MEAMREAWSDDRLDDLNRSVEEGFKRTSADIRALRGEMNGLRGEMNGLRGEVNGLRGEMNGLRGEMNDRFMSLEARFDAMRKTQILLFVGIITGLIGVIASILATGA